MEDEFDATMHAHFAEEFGDVRLHRAFGNAELLGYGAVRQPFVYKTQNLVLARGELRLDRTIERFGDDRTFGPDFAAPEHQ